MPGSRDYRRERLRGSADLACAGGRQVSAESWMPRSTSSGRWRRAGRDDADGDGPRADSTRRRPVAWLASILISYATPPSGAGDYLAIATAFHTLILDGIPLLSPDNFDQARRFIVLVDTLYDQRVKLIASADATPDKLYEHGRNAKMFERTASRLDEMQSQDWLRAGARAVADDYVAGPSPKVPLPDRWSDPSRPAPAPPCPAPGTSPSRTIWSD